MGKLPDTKEGLEAAGYLYDNDSTCRGCGDSIEWWITPNDKKMPMSVVTDKKDGGLFSPERGLRRIPHWTHCENAKDFRNANKS